MMALAVSIAAFQPQIAWGAERRMEIEKHRVRFHVENVNRTPVTCASDGHAYDVAGTIVAPAGGARARLITVFVHGGASDGLAWMLPVAGYDLTAELARRGFTSLVIDRLGHGESGRPDGREVCVGSEADVVGQVIEMLRTGRYHAVNQPARAFDHVVLIGHSQGALVAEVVAYASDTVDAVGVWGWTDTLQSERLLEAGVRIFGQCASGGRSSERDGTGASGYNDPWPDARSMARDVFADADPRVVELVTGRASRDPCGFAESAPSAVASNLAHLGSVEIPVLLMYGAKDAMLTVQGMNAQRELFAGSNHVALEIVEGAGHAFFLERRAPDVHEVLAQWLTDHEH